MDGVQSVPEREGSECVEHLRCAKDGVGSSPFKDQIDGKLVVTRSVLGIEK